MRIRIFILFLVGFSFIISPLGLRQAASSNPRELYLKAKEKHEEGLQYSDEKDWIEAKQSFKAAIDLIFELLGAKGYKLTSGDCPNDYMP